MTSEELKILAEIKNNFPEYIEIIDYPDRFKKHLETFTDDRVDEIASFSKQPFRYINDGEDLNPNQLSFHEFLLSKKSDTIGNVIFNIIENIDTIYHESTKPVNERIEHNQAVDILKGRILEIMPTATKLVADEKRGAFSQEAVERATVIATGIMIDHVNKVILNGAKRLTKERALSSLPDMSLLTKLISQNLN